MPRPPRFDLPDHVQHVIHRGNDRRRVFRDARDCRRFLFELGEAADNEACAVHAYVLMPNHVHLLMTPRSPGAVGRTLQAIGRRFVPYLNRRHARTGALWEGRYRASLIDSERYFLTCSRYVELNPVRAGLVATPQDYAWSSFRGNALGRPDPLLTPHPVFEALGADDASRRAAYRALFATALSAASLEAIRRATNGGRPLGGAAFRERLPAAATTAADAPESS